MKKTLVLSLVFAFTMALASPIMASPLPQEPVKKEQSDKKKEEGEKKECTEKKGCCDKKKECSEKKEEKKS